MKSAPPHARPPSPPTSPVETNTAVLDLSVVIVNYNVREFLQQALASVYRAQADLDMEVFVVDNNSADGSVAMVRAQYPDVHVVANTDNVGFGRANNQAIRQARGRYLMILNPDTIVQEDTFTTLIAFMDARPEAGAVGCRILNPDGTFARESRRAFPTPEVAFYRVSGLSRLFPNSKRFGRYNLTYLPRDQVAEVDALSGSCMLVRRAALYRHADRPPLDWESAEGRATPMPETEDAGAGLFDEGFFMYGEDLDWCFRIKEVGWKIYYNPDTQIIHYKGESTKRGELRYVRLFYGAMIQFVQKHFHDRYSKLFAATLHTGILIRAAQTVVANTVRQLRMPFWETVLVWLALMVVAKVRSLPVNFSFAPFFYYAVAPAYALIIIGCIGLAGGYRRRKRNTFQPVVAGLGAAFLLVTTFSFFVKSVAYSRAVVLFGFLAAGLGLLLLRWVRRERSERRIGPRQALLVGARTDVRRLQSYLQAMRQPPFELVGYVPPEAKDAQPRAKVQTLAMLGTLPQLRDIVRLRHIDDIIFIAERISNEVMFRVMRNLQDLPVEFKMLPKDQQYVIGKAYIGELAGPPLVEAEQAVQMPRGMWPRRLASGPVAVLGLVLYPVLALLARLGGGPRLTRWAARAAQMPAVLAGRKALVGYAAEHPYRPPEEWDLRPGVVPVVPAGEDLDEAALRRAYWEYAQHQSAGLDLKILFRDR